MDRSEFLTQLFQFADAGWLAIWRRSDKRTSWYDLTNLSRVLREIERDYPETSTDVYFGVGVQAQRASGRGTRETVAGLVTLWLDVDYGKAHTKPNLPATAEDALERILSFPASPSILVSTGNGYHAYYLLKEYWQFDTDDDRKQAEELCEQFQAAFRLHMQRRGWTIDATWDLARVLRLPETINSRGDARVHVLDEHSSLVRYGIDDLREIIDMFPASTSDTVTAAQEQSSVTIVVDANASPPLDKWLLLSQIDETAARTFSRQRSDLADQSPSGYDMALAVRAVVAGWTDQEICNLLIAHRRHHNDEIKRDDYFARTIQRARAYVAQRQVTSVLDCRKLDSELTCETLSDDERRASILRNLSKVFGVELHRIVKYNTRKAPTYRLETARGAVQLGSVSNLIGQSALRNHLAAASGHYLPRIKPRDWDVVAQQLLDACVEEGVSDDTSDRAVETWIDMYLSHEQPASGDDWVQAALDGRPFARDNTVYISLMSLRRYITATLSEQISSADLAAELRARDYEPRVLNVRGTTTRSVWGVRQSEQ